MRISKKTVAGCLAALAIATGSLACGGDGDNGSSGSSGQSGSSTKPGTPDPPNSTQVALVDFLKKQDVKSSTASHSPRTASEPGSASATR